MSSVEGHIPEVETPANRSLQPGEGRASGGDEAGAAAQVGSQQFGGFIQSTTVALVGGNVLKLFPPVMIGHG